MNQSWVVTRRHVAEFHATVAEAGRVLAAARADLGHNLGGFSAVDLLLDKLPQIRSVREAQNVLRRLGE